MSACARIRPLLELLPLAAAEGLLEPEERRELDEHLASCAGCRDQAAQLEQAYESLTETVEESMQPLSPELRERVLAGQPEQKKGVVSGHTADPQAVEALRLRVVLSCSFCHDGMQRGDAVFCASCLAPHHRDCFLGHGACSMPGCEETEIVRPAGLVEEPPRRLRRRPWILGAVLGAVGTLAAWKLVESVPYLFFWWNYRQVPAPTASVTPAPTATPSATAAPSATPAPPASPAPSPTPSAVAAAIDVDFSDVPLRDAVLEIADRGRLNALVDPGVDETVSVSLMQIDPREALDVIARMTQCELQELPGGVLLFTQPPRVTIQFAQANVRTVLQLIAAYSGKNIVLDPRVSGTVNPDFHEVPWLRALHTTVESVGAHLGWVGDVAVVTAAPLPAEAILAPQEGVSDLASEQKINVDVEQADLETLCEQIGRQVGANLLVDPSVKETVTCRLRSVPWRAAVEALARLTRCRVEDRGSGIVLLTQPPPVTITATDCPAPAFYKLLASYAGKSVVSGGAQGTVTVDLKECDYLPTLQAVALAQGQQVELGEDVVRISPAPWAQDWKPVATTPTGPPSEERSQRDRRLDALLSEIARLVRAGDAAAAQAKLAEAVALAQGRAPAASQQPAPMTPERAATEAEIDQLFGEINALAKAQDVDGLIDRLTQLNHLLRRYAEVNPNDQERRAQLERWNQRLEGLGEVRLSVQLQVDLNEINLYLRNMASAIREERYQEALDEHERLQALLVEMRGQQREVFGRNADAAQERGDKLAEQARQLQRIGHLQLKVTALVIFGEEAREASGLENAAVVNSQPVSPGQSPLDAEGEALQDLKVTAIEQGQVRFRLGELEFLRQLGGE